jgi:hypothetical protein
MGTPAGRFPVVTTPVLGLVQEPVIGSGAVAVARMFGRGILAFAGSNTGVVELCEEAGPVTRVGAFESPPPLHASKTRRKVPRAAWFKRRCIAHLMGGVEEDSGLV